VSIKATLSVSALRIFFVEFTARRNARWNVFASSRPAGDTKQREEKVSFLGHLKFLLVK